MKKFRFINCLILVLGLLLSISLPSIAKEIKFAELSDIHYSLAGETKSSRDISKAGFALQATVSKLNKTDMDFIIFLGDNIDSSKPELLEGFMNIVKGLNKPYYILIGNHDAHKASGISKEDYLAIVRKYNKNQTSKQAYFTFDITPEVIGVIMDGSANTVPTARGHFNQKKLDWLDKTLTKNQKKKVLIFQHYPLLEPENNPSHSIINKEAYLKVLKNHKNVVLISSGHYHSKKVQTDESGIIHVSAPSFYDEPFEYNIIKINYDKTPFSKIENFEIKVQEERLL